jgi:hypothetical protein
MNSYLIYQKPEATKDDEMHCIIDGFNIWAMVLGVFWSLYNKMWLVSLALVVINLIISTLPAAGWLGLLISLFMGFEGSMLLAKKLEKSGYVLKSIIVARDIEEAELKFLQNEIEGC